MHAAYNAADADRGSICGTIGSIMGLKTSTISANIVPQRYLRTLKASSMTTRAPAQTTNPASTTAGSPPDTQRKGNDRDSAIMDTHFIVVGIIVDSILF
jgi:hypothetical protein